MNLDFHYYGTLVAARFAGFSNEEADVIANADQFVDELSEDILKRDALRKLGMEPIATCMQTKEYLKYYSISQLDSWKDSDLVALQRIWMPFHFLPGNFTGEVAFEGDGKYRRDTVRMNRFKLMCLPNSELVEAVVNAAVKDYRETGNLARVGLVMHVLADTWAHEYFMGRPEKYVNDFGKMQSYEGGVWKDVKFGSYDDPQKQEYEAFPMRFPTEQGISYMGHAQAGHIPDYSYMRFRYTALWKQESCEGYAYRDNVSGYKKVFAQVVYALKCVRNGVRFRVNTYDSLEEGEAYEEEMNRAIETVQTDASCNWMNLARKVMGKMPYCYDRNEWVDGFLAAVDRRDTEYYRFQVGAAGHLDTVEREMKRRGFSLERNV